MHCLVLCLARPQAVRATVGGVACLLGPAAFLESVLAMGAMSPPGLESIGGSSSSSACPTHIDPDPGPAWRMCGIGTAARRALLAAVAAPQQGDMTGQMYGVLVDHLERCGSGPCSSLHEGSGCPLTHAEAAASVLHGTALRTALWQHAVQQVCSTMAGIDPEAASGGGMASISAQAAQQLRHGCMGKLISRAEPADKAVVAHSNNTACPRIYVKILVRV